MVDMFRVLGAVTFRRENFVMAQGGPHGDEELKVFGKLQVLQQRGAGGHRAADYSDGDLDKTKLWSVMPVITPVRCILPGSLKSTYIPVDVAAVTKLIAVVHADAAGYNSNVNSVWALLRSKMPIALMATKTSE